MGYETEYKRWVDRLAQTSDSEALAAYDSNDEAKRNAFYRDLEFGTAGMRGVLGMGTNMMNVYTVRRASAGLAKWMQQCGIAAQGCAIGYDSRHGSEQFAHETAKTLAAAGVRSYLYPHLAGVPLLSYTVRALGCGAGVLITASHNPAKYNGYKVYGADGAQLVGEATSALTDCVNSVDDLFAVPVADEDDARAQGLIVDVPQNTVSDYLAQVRGLLRAPQLVREYAPTLPIVYTPLHGSGRMIVSKTLSALGFPLQVVAAQAEPDGDFPTVSAPNPEDPAAFKLAMEQAEQCGARILLATDPDCDRLGVSLQRADGSWQLLNGNQIGCLLLDNILSLCGEQERSSGFVVRSIVSTPLSDRIAAAYNVELRHVLTGFKYIGEQITLEESAGGNKRFLFGFEESYGYLSGDFVRDKDACIAVLLMAELACCCAAQGETILDRLDHLYQRYGYQMENCFSFTREGADGIKAIAAAVASLRRDPPQTIGADKITHIRDFAVGADGLPPADVLEFSLPHANVIVRPSGTEPKLKVYTACAAATRDEADRDIAALTAAAKSMVGTRLE